MRRWPPQAAEAAAPFGRSSLSGLQTKLSIAGQIQGWRRCRAPSAENRRRSAVVQETVVEPLGRSVAAASLLGNQKIFGLRFASFLFLEDPSREARPLSKGSTVVTYPKSAQVERSQTHRPCSPTHHILKSRRI